MSSRECTCRANECPLCAKEAEEEAAVQLYRKAGPRAAEAYHADAAEAIWERLNELEEAAGGSTRRTRTLRLLRHLHSAAAAALRNVTDAEELLGLPL